jgi:hypothetical protein
VTGWSASTVLVYDLDRHCIVRAMPDHDTALRTERLKVRLRAPTGLSLGCLPQFAIELAEGEQADEIEHG